MEHMLPMVTTGLIGDDKDALTVAGNTITLECPAPVKMSFVA